MRFMPHGYQRFAIEYIKTHEVAAVVLDMGLGKTVITLTAILDLMFDSFEIGKVLVIAPLRVARVTWPEEIRKWEHTRMLTCSVAAGTERERLAALRAPADIHVINRENVEWLVERSGLPFDYDMVVIDELSSFKSHRAKRSRALMKARPLARRVVGLTGTPSANGLMDLFAEYRVLDMGKRLGRFISHYREKYFLPDKRSAAQVFTYKPKAGAEDAIYRAISDITISMKACDHLKMPDRVERETRVTLSPRERATYERLKKEMVTTIGGKEIDAMSAGALAGKLLQMANGAAYDESGNPVAFHSRKLDALEDLVESANGRPVLVAYWFQHDRERIKARLPAREIRAPEDIAAWNRGEIAIGLIHPAAAGHGLNLQQGGSTLIWYGLTWSLELYQQTNARLWRQGQRDTVVIQHIVAAGTIDERVLGALRQKDKTQAALIDAVRAELGRKTK